MPGTSVQISTRLAFSSAPKYAAEVSEPPRPRIAVPPSPWRADEALREQHRRGLLREAFDERGIAVMAAVHRQTLRPCARIRERYRIQPLPRIAPAEIVALRTQIGCAERRRQQLALCQHFGLPVERALCRAWVGAERLQRGQAFAQHCVGI
jgi:hypothetical protein